MHHLPGMAEIHSLKHRPFPNSSMMHTDLFEVLHQPFLDEQQQKTGTLLVADRNLEVTVVQKQKRVPVPFN